LQELPLLPILRQTGRQVWGLQVTSSCSSRSGEINPKHSIRLSVVSILLLSFAPFLFAQKLAPYVFVTHVATTDGDIYTLRHGSVILKVRYKESQTSSWPEGDEWRGGFDFVKYLHFHSRLSSPDLSQIPAIGTGVNECVMDKDRDSGGDRVVAIQPTNAPCLSNNGRTLHLLPTPNGNGPNAFAYVNFEILSERGK
jgi:hypothetical protein